MAKKRGGYRGTRGKSRGLTKSAKRSAPVDGMFDYNVKKSKYSDLEKQFEFPDVKNTWQEKGVSQKIMGSDYIIINSLSPIVDGAPKIVEFELKDSEEVWSMGPNTCFKIKGQFQVAKPPTAPATQWVYEPCSVLELDKVVVQPNWFEASLKLIEEFHGYSKINTSDEARHVPAFLNAWKYNFMEKSQKKLLLPQPSCSGWGVPNKKNSWTVAADSEWRTKYGPQIFNEKMITFDYLPSDFPPLVQGANYMQHQQNILPMPLLDKISIRMSFIDDLSAIFKKEAANLNRYRFYFQEIKLVVEKLKLNLNTKERLMAKKGKWEYAGVTRIMKTENPVAKELNHKAKIQGMLLPEGLFIFALPKKVLSGDYTYQESDGNVFSPHNIKSIDIKYGNLDLFTTRPNLGMIRDDVIESKLFIDYLNAAPFGLDMDPDKITVANIENGWEKTPYPHVYINLCNYGDKSRLIPNLNNGSMLKVANEMELSINFNATGATPDVTYIIYYFYTDNNLTLDTSHPNQSFFVSPYLKLV